MAKATLVNAEMIAEPINTHFMTDNSNRPTFEIHGPIRYIYHLEYVSYEPLSLSDFPREIDIDNVEVVGNALPLPTIKVQKEQVKQEQINRPKVNNAIQQLELTDN